MELDLTDKGFVMDTTEVGDLELKPSNEPHKALLYGFPRFEERSVQPFPYSADSSWIVDEWEK